MLLLRTRPANPIPKITAAHAQHPLKASVETSNLTTAHLNDVVHLLGRGLHGDLYIPHAFMHNLLLLLLLW